MTDKELVNMLNNKLDNACSNLSLASTDINIKNRILHDIYNNLFTIIYPFGTEENPGTIAVNSSYKIENPFPDYYVDAQVEIYADTLNEWGIASMHSYYSGGYYGHGMYIHQHNDGDLILKTGKNYLVYASSANDRYAYPNTFSSLAATVSTSIPFRVKVWKIGVKPRPY